MSATHRHSLPEAVPRSASKFSSLSAALSLQNVLTFLLSSGTFQYPDKVSLLLPLKQDNPCLLYTSDDSKQNYGAPKITVELRKNGEVISERTVGTYMRQMGIRAQWSKPWTITTKDSDFSTELQNILDEQFNPDRPNAVWCSDITYILSLIHIFIYKSSLLSTYIYMNYFG